MNGPVLPQTPAIGRPSLRSAFGRSRALLRVFRLLTLLLVVCPVMVAMAVFDMPPSSERHAAIGIGATPLTDDTPQLTRLGNETDDLREAIAGPMLRFGVVRQRLAAFAPRRTDRIEASREPPPDRPPRSFA